MEKKLIIMRGLPGSGKSTKVAEIVKSLGHNDYAICSNDNYPGYYNTGSYVWTPEAAKAASKWCWNQFYQALQGSVSVVIIDNTNLSKKKWQKFVAAAEPIGYEVVFEEIVPDESMLETYAKRNVHKVDLERIKQMFAAWEEIKDD